MKKRNTKYPIKTLIGKQYGKLIILMESDPYIRPNGLKQRKVLARCDCGNIKSIRLDHIIQGCSLSCGCLQKEITKKLFTKHELSYHSLYKAWSEMKNRCYNQKSKWYKNYGGRGIHICDEWKNDAKEFIKWALNNGWKKGLVIDRIKNDEDYSSSNCRFVTYIISAQNKRLLMSTNTTGYRGVSWDKSRNKYVAQIGVNKKHIHIGYFNDPLDAAKAYDEKAKFAAFPLNASKVLGVA